MFLHRSAYIFAIIVALGTSIFAQSPGRRSLVRAARVPIEGQYLVALRAADDPEAVGLEAAGMFAGRLKHVYRTALRGFSAHLSRAAAEALARDPRVAYVQQDGLVALTNTQFDPPWGLDRTDQRGAVALGDRRFEYTADGAGVHAYVIDSGIRTTHTEFAGRAFEAFTAVDDGVGAQDCYGHGTHVAGIIGGKTYGVAKNVTLHSVRVFDCAGNPAAWSTIIAAIDWVIQHHVKPAVINMSLSGPAYEPGNEAVRQAVAAGIVVAVAAGNNGIDACNNSPGSATEALTVAASGFTDARESYSNYGACADLFAPGGAILSAFVGSDTATATMSGTSMATPHVSGAAALYLENYRTATPAQVAAAIIATTTTGAVTDPAGTANRLLFTPLLGQLDRPTPSTWTTDAIGGSRGAVGVRRSADALTISAEGSDVWNSADAFQFVHRPWTGDGDLIVRLTELVKPADAQFAMAGVMFRESLSADSRHATLLVSTNGKAKFRRRLIIGDATLSDGPGAGTTAVPKWLKLVRRGDTFSAYLSNDGEAWQQVHSTQTIGMAANVEVGVFALRSSGADMARATFTAMELAAPLASGWSSADVGDVGAWGSASLSQTGLTINAGGTDLWNTSDAFHIVYRRWSGDGVVVARIGSLTNPDGSAFTLGALTFRETLNENARHVTVLVSSQGKVKFRRRLTTGGTTLSDGPSATGTFSPRWLKLMRSAGVFTAYQSLDGARWEQVALATPLTLPSTVYVGMVALRNGGTSLGRTALTDVTIK
jgi:regulation of enolase protein 1 (concanavalin A-like superfamily)